MASSGSFNTTKYEGRYLKFSWEVVSQSTTNNNTKISWKLVGAGTGESGYYTSGNFKVVINGKTVYSSSDRINLYNGTEVASGTTTIAHNSDGTKTFSASAEAGIYYVAVNCKGSGSWTLPTIAKKAVMVSAPNFTVDDNPTITYTNSAGSAVDSLEACISLTGATDDIPYRTISKTSGTYTFYLTEAEKQTLINATSGTSRSVRFYVKTIIDGTKYTSYISRTFSIAEVEPEEPDDPGTEDGGDEGGTGGGGGGIDTGKVSVSGTVEDGNTETVALTGDKNIFVRYYSDASFNFDAETTSGFISDSYCLCGGKQVSGTSGTIYDVESGTFKFVAKNSYGVSGSYEITKTLINYIKLTCNISNDKPDTSGNMNFTISGNYFNGSFGAQTNTLTVMYRYRSSTSNYTEWTTVSPTITNNTYSVDVNVSGLNYQSSYTFEVRAVDLLATVDASARDVSASPIFQWDNTRFDFSVPILAARHLVPNTGLGIYSYDASTGESLLQFSPGDSNNVIRFGEGNYDNKQGIEWIYGNDTRIFNNKSVDITAPEVNITGQTEGGFGDGGIFFNSFDVRCFDGSISGAIRAMTTEYELDPYVVGGAQYSAVSITAHLVGNTLRGNISATRSSAFGSGNISNETVAIVQIPHGGKIKSAYATCFGSGGTGPTASFVTANMSNSNNTLSFNINLAATAGSGSELSAYFQIPVLLNLNAY